MMNSIAVPETVRPFLEDNKANHGFCPVCTKETWFVERDSWLRDSYECNTCGSIPRQRALLNTMNTFAPNWCNLKIHESSPDGVSSDFIKSKSAFYSDSHFTPKVPTGEMHNGFRNENISALTFDDASFDLFISQDVMEHVMHPQKAFSEIGRVLKPGGSHIFTIPWYGELSKSRPRVIEEDGKLNYLMDAEYHGTEEYNGPHEYHGPYLVTWDWGRDIAQYIFEASGMHTTINRVQDRSIGLDGRFLEAFISQKPH